MYRVLSSILLIFLFSVATQPSHAGEGRAPKLIVFISVDQMRQDYFERFGDEFTGGLGRIYREGVFFSHADLNYAASETGPGHATLATGQYPRHSGIPGNDWLDPRTGRMVYCVEDSGAGQVHGEGGYRSPKNLLVSSVGDWLKTSSPSSKVISISSKDRAAILMGGKNPDIAFWYAGGTGHMVTSSYYADSLGDWVIRFNESDWIGHHLPASWEKLLPDERYASDEIDDFSAEFPWGGSTQFPHVFTNPGWQILTSPYGDYLTLDFANEAVVHEGLGQRDVPDMLCISLSCTDYVGHSFGPNSQEMHDHLLRLDRRLGEFLARLEEKVGRDKIFIALSADHGVMPLPEYLVAHGNRFARRINFESQIKTPVLELDSILRKEFHSSQPVLTMTGLLDYDAAARNGIDSIGLERKLRAALLSIHGIEDVFFRRELILPDGGERPFIDLFRHSYYSSRGEDFQFRFCEWCIMSWKAHGTTHGSPYDYDTHVPVAFLWSGLIPAKVLRPITTLDIAPTIGTVLDLPLPPGLDGRILPEISQ